MQGMADPVAGAAQFAANLPGVRSLAGESVNSGILAKEGRIRSCSRPRRPSRVRRSQVRRQHRSSEQCRPCFPHPSSSRIPWSGHNRRGGRGVGAAMTPETDTDNYWGKTAQKAAVGGAAGAVLAPVAGAVGDRIGRMFGGSGAPPAGGLPPIPGAPGTHAADAVIARAAAEAGQSIDDIPQSVLYQLRAQAQHALSQNQTLDTAAALRKADFEAIGLQPLLGQITRDPMQFAREKNLRGIAGAGEPIAARLAGQTEGLSRTLGGFAQGADEAFAGGQKIARGLGSIDARARGVVDDAYNAARDSAGRYVDLDNVGFVKAANDALDEGMLGHYLPAQVRNMLNDVSTGKIPLNVNTAVQMDSVLSARSAAHCRQSAKPWAQFVTRSIARALQTTPAPTRCQRSKALASWPLSASSCTRPSRH
jgi:hypothetical protein